MSSAPVGESAPASRGAAESRPVPIVYASRPRAISSAGRAPSRQGGGHWFEPSIAHHGNAREIGRFSLSEASVVLTWYLRGPVQHALCAGLRPVAYGPGSTSGVRRFVVEIS